MKKKQAAKVTLQVRISPENKAFLEGRAQEEDRSLAWVVESMLDTARGSGKTFNSRVQSTPRGRHAASA